MDSYMYQTAPRSLKARPLTERPGGGRTSFRGRGRPDWARGLQVFGQSDAQVA